MAKIKILVVDDDEINRMVLGGILESVAHELLYAENGLEGVELVHFRLVVDDGGSGRHGHLVAGEAGR